MLGFTIEGARCMRMENEIGSLSQGKKANFCILNKNAFDIPVEELDTVETKTVVFEGNPIKGDLCDNR